MKRIKRWNDKKEFIGFSVYRFIDSTVRYVLMPKNERTFYDPSLIHGNKVCVLLDKGMGDFVLFAYYLKVIITFYENKKVTVDIIADTYNIEFLRAFYPELERNCIVLNRNRIDLVNGQILSDFRGEYSLAILPTNAITPRQCQLLRVLSPKHILSEGNEKFLRNYLISDYKLFNIVESVMFHKEFYVEMHRRLAQKITGLDYGLKLAHPINVSREITDRYCVINVSANRRSFLLFITQFIRIGECLGKRYNLKVVLIGDTNLEAIKNVCIDNRIFITNYLNLRDMKKTISICKYADFIVTCDTGIYHLGVTLETGTKVFVPTWSYKDSLFEPYPFELCGNKLFYIRKYKDCKECSRNKLWCFIKRRRNKALVHCVETMPVEFICKKIETVLDMYYKI